MDSGPVPGRRRWHVGTSFHLMRYALQPSMEDIQSAINGGAVAGAPALASLSCNAQVEPPDILGTCDGVAVFTRFH